jgi:hypothetical protein
MHHSRIDSTRKTESMAMATRLITGRLTSQKTPINAEMQTTQQILIAQVLKNKARGVGTHRLRQSRIVSAKNDRATKFPSIGIKIPFCLFF